MVRYGTVWYGMIWYGIAKGPPRPEAVPRPLLGPGAGRALLLPGAAAARRAGALLFDCVIMIVITTFFSSIGKRQTEGSFVHWQALRPSFQNLVAFLSKVYTCSKRPTIFRTGQKITSPEVNFLQVYLGRSFQLSAPRGNFRPRAVCRNYRSCPALYSIRPQGSHLHRKPLRHICRVQHHHHRRPHYV